LDEFPARHQAGPDLEPESRRGLVAAVVVVGVVLTLAALYFYGFSRRGPAPDEVLGLAPAAGDTEVDVVPDAPLGSAPTGGAAPEAGAAAGESAREVAPPPDVLPAEPEPAATLGTGRIVVRSSPSGALVTIDGVMAGTTPVSVDDLAYGAHLVQVARPGFVPAREEVELSEAVPSRTLAVALEAGAERPGDAPAVGSLDVDSRPRGATVRLDGRLAGLTPLRLGSVGTGQHVVELDLAGYRVVRAEVTVERGRPSRLAVTLEPGGS
jgi:hypothetical protein